MNTVREILGLHRERYVFPACVLVTKVSGDGVDSVFMGVFKVCLAGACPLPFPPCAGDAIRGANNSLSQAVEEDKNLVRAYVAPGGSILCCDLRFMDWFGKTSADLQGKQFHTLAMEQGDLEQ
jgi:hypothetical protein